MTEPPDSPDGYTDPDIIPSSRLRHSVWTLAMLTVSIVVYLPGVRQTLIVNPFLLIIMSPELILYAVPFVVFAAVNVVVHEKIHKVASQLTGYQSELRLEEPIRHLKEPYNYIPDAWVNSGDYKVILLAPLFVINLFAASLVVMSVSSIITELGKIFLVVNTAMSADDIRMVIRGLTSHGTTKYHHAIDSYSLAVYEAVEADK